MVGGNSFKYEKYVFFCGFFEGGGDFPSILSIFFSRNILSRLLALDLPNSPKRLNPNLYGNILV
jgi:hypothetical protein